MSLIALVLGMATLLSLPRYLGLAGLLIGLWGMKRHERLAKAAVAVCVIGVAVNLVMSLFLYDVLASLLYQP